jgi:hypothetical protein
MFKVLLTFFSIFLLVGCKADLIEIAIKSNEIKDVLNGETLDIEFETNFSLMAELDDQTKMELERIEVIASKYATIEDFDVTENEYFGLDIAIEGELPLLYSADGSIPTSISSPWVLLISDNKHQGVLSEFQYKLEFTTTPSYDAFDGELQNINMLLTADKYQPVKFKLRNKDSSNFRIFTGAVEGDGQSHATLETDVLDKISLTMKEGIYNKTNQVIFFNIE